MVRSRNPARSIAGVLLWFTAAAAHALTITVDFHDAGFFGMDGRSSKEDAEALGFPTTPGAFANYHAGLSDGYSAPPYPDSEVRNFFVFGWADVAAAYGGTPTGPVVAAKLSLYNPGVGANGVDGYISVDPEETYVVSDIGPKSPADVMAHYDHPFYGGPDEAGAAASVFAALGTGPVFGMATLSAADNGAYVDIPLSPGALGYLNSKLGSYLSGGDPFVAFGGRVVSITSGALGGVGDPYEEVFAFTHPGPYGSPATSASPPRLSLTFVPLPASGGFCLLGVVWLYRCGRPVTRRPG